MLMRLEMDSMFCVKGFKGYLVLVGQQRNFHGYSMNLFFATQLMYGEE